MTLPDDDLGDFELPDLEVMSSPESKFYSQQIATPAPKIENARIWLWQVLAPIVSLVGDSGLNITKSGEDASLSLIARELLRHYYLMYYHPRFYPTSEDVTGCDMDRFLDLVMSHSTIRKTIADAEAELGRQTAWRSA